MDNSNGSGNNLVLWLPGSALILSLVVSTFALTREPFLEPRPIGAQFQAQSPIEARLWQDPFDALERYRKKFKEGNKAAGTDFECSPKLVVSKPLVLDDEPQHQPPEPPQLMVALVEGGPYADEVELRRRIRYAILAGFKNSRMVPEDEQHIRCLALADDLSDRPITSQAGQQGKSTYAEIPYETFIANPFDPPRDIQDKQRPSAQTILLWVKQEHLGSHPLQQLEALRLTLQSRLHSDCGPPQTCPGVSNQTLLKVIGPSTSKVLLDMYRDEANGDAKPDIEIYSPLATADYDTLIHALGKPSPGEAASREPAPATPKPLMKLLRTVSDDGVMTRLLLEELKLRHVDPVAGVQCSDGVPLRVGTRCNAGGWQRSNRIALVSEWDSFYSRALIESFKSQVAKDADIEEKDQAAVNDWVLHFSYLRGVDGRLPEEAASANKAPGTDDNKNSKDKNTLDLSPLEKSDGNSQLDYLRRLADHILREDETYRRNGASGIGAIGVLGADTYDKLLVLQALKGRMPNKVFFSTNLDARMLQRGQAQTTRNLVLAAPYGLTLTRALQQDVPPFRDSLQSAVFIAVLAAQSPQPYDAKRVKFDYKSELLSPGIYEVGINGFIALSSQLTATRPKDCTALVRSQLRPNDIMALRCLQDPSPSPYPELSQSVRDTFDEKQSLFWAGPLWFVLLVIVILLGWWWTYVQSSDDKLPAWVRSIPLTLYVVSGLSAWLAIQSWRVELMWMTFILILLGVVCSGLIRRAQRQPSYSRPAPAQSTSGLFDASAWYIVVPIVIFVLALLWMYQARLTLMADGLGEPMFLFEGISAWPTVALRLLAVVISISALAWGWRTLRINSAEIERAYHLDLYMSRLRMSLLGQLLRLVHREKGTTLHKWRAALGRCLFLILFPLSSNTRDWHPPSRLATTIQSYDADQRMIIFVTRFWKEHCVGGTFGARMLRTVLATWIFVVVTSVLFVLWPMDGAPIRGESPIWMLNWLLPTLAFQLLVFWVVDANRLLTRFIRQLSKHYAVWPRALREEHRRVFGMPLHPCIDDWMDMQLIAKRTATVNRLIYAPTVVMLILIASRNSVFDNWPTPPSIIISFLLTTLILLTSALSLRRAAEQARTAALQRLDNYRLETPEDAPIYKKLELIRARIVALNTGAFSSYSQEPLVRALLLSLTGVGGSLIVDVLNYAKF
ncbi:hypothetical protein [Pseudomonas chlororaphis]|uniref:hypothetical protein n=1 Tax=Pseudomonas chlororaphis TaxID=587753 RepID=UPI001B30E2B8|nr:hypothetical protein [Pseudomonas chlororaphis]QTT89334.1 hypothetical protein HUT28_18760 [Pseudomonas chlororaphis]